MTDDESAKLERAIADLAALQSEIATLIAERKLERRRCLDLLTVLRSASRLFDVDTYQVVFWAMQRGVGPGKCTKVLEAIAAEKACPFWEMSPSEREHMWDDETQPAQPSGEK